MFNVHLGIIVIHVCTCYVMNQYYDVQCCTLVVSLFLFIVNVLKF